MSVNKQLNMQISNEEEILAPLRKLNLLDDFLFDVATVDLETCKIILELSLGIHIKKLSWREGQKVVHNLPGYRGIRMDFYAVAEDGTVFDPCRLCAAQHIRHRDRQDRDQHAGSVVPHRAEQTDASSLA